MVIIIVIIIIIIIALILKIINKNEDKYKMKRYHVKKANPPLICINSKHSEIVATANKMPLPLPIALRKSDKT